ncbi:MAG: rod shape-determining protein MreC [Proteobacteria bacterium SG_bin5]|nr:MAG: rod shape-determining protein MreC [Proteobacteria bacterium SG_bin5]
MASRPRRPGFSRRAQYGVFASYVVVAAGVIVALLLLALWSFDPRTFGVARQAAAEVTTPLSSGVSWAARGVASVPQGVSDYFGVIGRNKALRAEIAANKRLTDQAKAVLYENARLKALLKLRQGSNDTVVAAHLVSSSAASTRRYAVLNAGSLQGVREGQPVRGPEGLIGRVIETGFNTARVLLISDPESIVPVRRVRDGLPALAAGRGDGLIEIRAVNLANAPFAVGDAFVTSGTGGIYAPGIPVARVIAAGRDTTSARAFTQPDTLDVAIVQRSFIAMPAPAPEPR